MKRKINTNGHIKINQEAYPVSKAEKLITQKQNQKTLERAISQRSECLWSSLIMLVRTKNDCRCLYLYYSKRKSIKEKHTYTIPPGYWQIEVNEKTAFITPENLYEFKVMRIGLCNALATLKKCGHLLHLFKCIRVFVT